jgi:hypothetical protein
MSRAFVLVLLAAIALGSPSSWTPAAAAQPAAAALDRPAAEISGGPWINSSPLTLQALRGRVVFVEFWTYG